MKLESSKLAKEERTCNNFMKLPICNSTGIITETVLEHWGYTRVTFGQSTSEAESHLVKI